VSGILVIKLGALGDFVQATGPFAAIRRHHPNAKLTLLTTPPYAELARALKLFDEIWDDGRKRSLLGQINLVRRLRRARFDRVYDLQTSQRSSFLFQMLRPNPPEWSGIARGCSHPHANRARDFLHTLERQAEQLAIAGVPARPEPPDLSALALELWPRTARFGLTLPYGVLIPGGSPNPPGKRWPAQNYGALAAYLAGEGILPVLEIGRPAEPEIARVVLAAAPGTKDLGGGTDLLDLLALGAKARLVVGNATGPLHLMAAAGAPTITLFGPATDPALCAARGARVKVVQVPDLSALSFETLLPSVRALL
jgi:ADP-heptose:LPS heptosyltransferase